MFGHQNNTRLFRDPFKRKHVDWRDLSGKAWYKTYRGSLMALRSLKELAEEFLEAVILVLKMFLILSGSACWVLFVFLWTDGKLPQPSAIGVAINSLYGEAKQEPQEDNKHMAQARFKEVRVMSEEGTRSELLSGTDEYGTGLVAIRREYGELEMAGWAKLREKLPTIDRAIIEEERSPEAKIGSIVTHLRRVQTVLERKLASKLKELHELEGQEARVLAGLRGIEATSGLVGGGTLKAATSTTHEFKFAAKSLKKLEQHLRQEYAYKQDELRETKRELSQVKAAIAGLAVKEEKQKPVSSPKQELPSDYSKFDNLFDSQ